MQAEASAKAKRAPKNGGCLYVWNVWHGAHTIDLEPSNILQDNESMGIHNSQRGNRKPDKLVKIFNLPMIRETQFISRNPFHKSEW